MKRRVGTDFSRWQRVRRRVLHRDNHLCCVCKRAIATEVDHIIPAHTLKSAAEELDMSNLQSICYPCHRRKTTSEMRGSGRDLTALVDHYYV